MDYRIKSLRFTVQLLLRSLPEGILFNLICFGATWKALFEGSKEYNQETLDAASAFVSTMNADMGNAILYI